MSNIVEFVYLETRDIVFVCVLYLYVRSFLSNLYHSLIYCSALGLNCTQVHWCLIFQATATRSHT
jgi:hypothetical protein